MRAAMVVCTSVLFLVVTWLARPRHEACSVPRSPLDIFMNRLSFFLSLEKRRSIRHVSLLGTNRRYASELDE
ncbi:hypothetical protein MUK42_34228, partial [Musa troglodytarum]